MYKKYTSNNHFTDRISVVNWVSLLWHLFRTWSDFGWSPLSKTNHLLTVANSCTTEAIVSSCSSGRGDRGESMRGMRRTKFVENLELWPLSHICSMASLCGSRAWLMVCQIWKLTKIVRQPSMSYSLKEAFNCPIRRARLSKYVTALILPSFQ